MIRALPTIQMEVDGVGRSVLVDTGCSNCVAHVSCCASWRKSSASIIAVDGSEIQCQGLGTVQLQSAEGDRDKVDVVVTARKPLGFDLILGMNAVMALGGVSISPRCHVRFGTEGEEISAAGVAGIKLEEKDFALTFDSVARCWTTAWRWSDGRGQDVLQNKVEEYAPSARAKTAYREELRNWIKNGWLVPYDERKYGPAKELIPLMAVVQRNKDKLMRTCVPKGCAHGENRSLGGRDRLVWRRDAEMVDVPQRLSRRSVFSYCGSLIGHFPVFGWLRVATAFLKRAVTAATLSWGEAVENSWLKTFVDEIAVKIRKEDPVRGEWNISGEQARLWVDASALAIGAALEVDGSIVEDAAWLRPNDACHINMAEASADVVQELEAVFWERGAPEELLADNDTAFKSKTFVQLMARWGVNLRFRCAYVPSGNGIAERCHRTVKVIAARKGCSIAEAVYLYNLTPRDNCRAQSAPASGIYRDDVRPREIDKPRKEEQPKDGPYAVG
uniref:Integrase catalytic domain-containing protein n=1 Tax=Trichuris muris TaxID=70415 RepID=A0A5S6QA32_TRIMR